MAENVEIVRQSTTDVEMVVLELGDQLASKGGKIVKLQDGRLYKMVKDTHLNRLDADNDTSEVSNYIFIKQAMGNGGFGMVYKAEMRNQNIRPCIKTGLHKKKYQSEDERVRGQREVNKSILREARHYKKLSNYPHDNIVSMQFCCTSQDYNEVFLALDYCKGLDLSEIVRHYRKKILPSKLLRKIMLESTAAVAHCLEHKIIHGDIKPSNFVFTRMDQPMKLIDFGCAVDIGKGLNPRRVVGGTYEYTAPEVMLHGIPDPKSDVYSLGTLFYTFVTRRAPWSHLTEFRDALTANDRPGVREIIKNKHEEYNVYLEKLRDPTAKPSPLQSALAESLAAHFVRKPAECDLTDKLLSFHPQDRFSCQQIIVYINTVCVKAKTVLIDGSSGDEGCFEIPPSVAFYNSTSACDDPDTTFSNDFKKKVSKAQRPTPSDDDVDQYGPATDNPEIPEEVKPVYKSALAEKALTINEMAHDVFQEMEKSLDALMRTISMTTMNVVLEAEENVAQRDVEAESTDVENQRLRLERDELERDKVKVAQRNAEVERREAECKSREERLAIERAEFEKEKALYNKEKK